MSDYVITHVGTRYEQGILRGVIVAACECGAGDTWPNKGMGRAHAAAWRSRHEHIRDESFRPERGDS